MVALLRTAEDGITYIHPTAFGDNFGICMLVFDEASYYAYYNHFISVGQEELAEYVQFIMYL